MANETNSFLPYSIIFISYAPIFFRWDFDTTLFGSLTYYEIDLKFIVKWDNKQPIIDIIKSQAQTNN